MRKKVMAIGIAALALIAAVFLLISSFSSSPSKTLSNAPLSISRVVINGHSFNVEVADTDAKRTQGLSGRSSLAPNAGMLFLFDRPGYYAFWMKEMEFPLDFIWINGGRIVSLNQNVPIPSDENIPTITPASTVDKVLEINAGTIQKNSIRIGDQVSFFL